MENDPRRRRPRGRRTPRDTPKPTRPPAQPRPPAPRGGAARPSEQLRPRRGDAGRTEPLRPDATGRGAGRDARGARGARSQRSRGRPGGGQGAPRDPGDLRVGTPCLIVLDCRDGEPDRSGAGATFEGFFDFETGEPRRPGLGFPRLRIVAPAAPPSPAIAAPVEGALAEEPPSGGLGPTRPRPLPAPVERLWGFECWWRPDPSRAGLTPEDHLELEQSKKLLRGLLRDTHRAGRSLQRR